MEERQDRSERARRFSSEDLEYLLRRERERAAAEGRMTALGGFFLGLLLGSAVGAALRLLAP